MSVIQPGQEKLSEQVVVRLNYSEWQYLDGMVKEGGYESRSLMLRSMIREIIRDDRASHSRAAE